ncbi:hypothetical protein FRB90_005698 [Tulasnella sp. 427]|nr:hypothetical protein FRB90_005698 [Tulasnella sp. 427]
MSPTPIILTITPAAKPEIPPVSIPTVVVSAPLSPSPQTPHALRSFFAPRGRARSILQIIQPDGPKQAKSAVPGPKAVKLEQALKDMDNAANNAAQPPSLAKNFAKKHRRNQSSISISSTSSSDGEGSGPLHGLHPSFKPFSRSPRNPTPVVISLDF